MLQLLLCACVAAASAQYKVYLTQPGPVHTPAVWYANPYIDASFTRPHLALRIKDAEPKEVEKARKRRQVIQKVTYSALEPTDDKTPANTRKLEVKEKEAELRYHMPVYRYAPRFYSLLRKRREAEEKKKDEEKATVKIDVPQVRLIGNNYWVPHYSHYTSPVVYYI